MTDRLPIAIAVAAIALLLVGGAPSLVEPMTEVRREHYDRAGMDRLVARIVARHTR